MKPTTKVTILMSLAGGLVAAWVAVGIVVLCVGPLLFPAKFFTDTGPNLGSRLFWLVIAIAFVLGALFVYRRQTA